MNPYDVPGVVLASGGTAVNKADKGPVFMRFIFTWKGRDKMEINSKEISILEGAKNFGEKAEESGKGHVGQRGRVEFCSFPKSGTARIDFLEKVTFRQ